MAKSKKFYNTGPWSGRVRERQTHREIETDRERERQRERYQKHKILTWPNLKRLLWRNLHLGPLS